MRRVVSTTSHIPTPLNVSFCLSPLVSRWRLLFFFSPHTPPIPPLSLSCPNIMPRMYMLYLCVCVFQALREEQNEAAMAMSSTTVGDDDGSVDTADTPTTVGSRNSRPRSHRVRSSNVSPAALAAAAGPDGEGGVPPGSRRGKTPSRSRRTAAAAGEGAPPEEEKATTASPVMPTPPRSEVHVDTLLVRVTCRWAR